MAEDVIEHYNLKEIGTPDSTEYCKVHQGMYGLPQAGIIAQLLLKECLNKHGYHQSQTTPGLWTQVSCPISFSLIVDNFGIKCVGKEHAQHLFKTICKYYKCSYEWEGERYCGLTINWDYLGRKVHLLMPEYV
jgi:hypothetical protein